MPTCKTCHNTNFVRDISNANNDLVCTQCGVVCEDNPIVSEVTFGESSSGAAVVHGSFLSADQSHGGGILESREQTLNNARRKLRAVSFALKIPEYITDAAFQWYKLCLTNNFVQGRKSQNVISACLYVACRKEKTHHMLIDFSSRLQVSVYSIGATFLKMCKQLHITDLPLADPSLYIQHFAEKLDLREKKNKVIRDAVQLASRMSKDWMYEGRRPAGIAGACLLLACRMNNLRRTHSEIVAVSHVGEDTLQTRLNEFKQLKSASLSVKDFRDENENSDLLQDKGELPPSLKKNRVKAAEFKKKLREKKIIETDAKLLKKDPILSQVLTEQELSSKEILYYLDKLSKQKKEIIERLKQKHGIDGNEETKKGEGAGELTDLHGEILDDENENDIKNKEDPLRPKNLHLLPTTDALLTKVSDEPIDLQDVDDDELDELLLDEQASKLKERIWLGLNGDYLLEQESKRLKQEADLLSGNITNSKVRKRNGGRKKQKSTVTAIKELTTGLNQSGLQQLLSGGKITASGEIVENVDVTIGDNIKNEKNTAAESVKTMLQGNSTFSKKINYDAIDGLFGN
ncbi:probable Transcription factor IIIB 70 kDa subunit [Saccharomycodes ludwigii]|uniref:Transcription factor IIIB 70 kDa subunit n=1 Tax=Saccharomycodes ludwigii TaxID=36035 RepID=A0A376B919_9ASCO|nr:hypothetical protein SCDLUD_004806 [Saccharomycodes ludwigii]KAH3899365.1 hypothetical protein SCDLUD_004806 [Saccharomycodes ludwigii]SSD61069.1 probable Transcription factor IIIB 70 kDa subunit [Saccharomycodes ludwigii]